MLKGGVSILAKEVKLSARVARCEADIGRNLPKLGGTDNRNLANAILQHVGRTPEF